MAIREALCKGNEILCALDTHERPLHCHHEKLVIVDDELAFVGGIDLTDFARQPARPPGPSAARKPRLARRRDRRCAGRPSRAVSRHFNLRWNEAAGELLPPPARAGPRR